MSKEEEKTKRRAFIVLSISKERNPYGFRRPSLPLRREKRKPSLERTSPSRKRKEGRQYHLFCGRSPLLERGIKTRDLLRRRQREEKEGYYSEEPPRDIMIEGRKDPVWIFILEATTR